MEGLASFPFITRPIVTNDEISTMSLTDTREVDPLYLAMGKFRVNWGVLSMSYTA